MIKVTIIIVNNVFINDRRFVAQSYRKVVREKQEIVYKLLD